MSRRLETTAFVCPDLRDHTLIAKYTVADIKSILRKGGLPQTGATTALVRRVRDSSVLPASEIQQLKFDPKTFNILQATRALQFLELEADGTIAQLRARIKRGKGKSSSTSLETPAKRRRTEDSEKATEEMMRDTVVRAGLSPNDDVQLLTLQYETLCELKSSKTADSDVEETAEFPAVNFADESTPALREHAAKRGLDSTTSREILIQTLTAYHRPRERTTPSPSLPLEDMATAELLE